MRNLDDCIQRLRRGITAETAPEVSCNTKRKISNDDGLSVMRSYGGEFEMRRLRGGYRALSLRPYRRADAPGEAANTRPSVRSRTPSL